MLPGVAVAGPLLAIRTSARCTSVVSSGSVLFDGTGSLSVALTVAVLVSRPGVGGVASVTPTAVAVPGARVPTVQVSTPAAAVQPAEPVRNAVPAGSVSVTLTLVAVAGPLFVMAKV